MSDKVWVVEEQMENSWGEGWTEDYQIISIHRTKVGAETMAEIVRKDKAVYALTGGEIEDHTTSPDGILGAIVDDELRETLRQEVAKPKADFIKAIFKIVEDHNIEIADITVDSRNISE